jgi:RHS repeat-associated protein
MQEKVIGASLAVSWNDYVMRGGEMVALHVTAASPQIRWFHKDHLGSIVALTNETGTVVERDSYDAWGERRQPAGPDDPLYPALSLTSQVTRGYTGHEQLDSVGLVHMNGRIYDPIIGKMMSADPTVPNPTDAQAYNRYAYVGNNPLSFTDPTGFQRDPPRGIQNDPGNGSGHLNDHPAHGSLCGCSIKGKDREQKLATLMQLRALQPAGDVLGVGLNIQTASSFGAYPVGPRSIPPITEDDLLDALGDLIGMIGAIAESNPEIPESPLALKGIRALDEMLAAERAAIAAAARARRAAELAKTAPVDEEAVGLAKSLASEQQVGELLNGQGQIIAGNGSRATLRDAERLSETYGGLPGDYSKVTSSSYKAADGTTVSTHAYQDASGHIHELKSVIDNHPALNRGTNSPVPAGN